MLAGNAKQSLNASLKITWTGDLDKYLGVHILHKRALKILIKIS